MSYLEKYARPRAEKNTRQYNAKIPEESGIEFEEYCKELNIKPAEAIRYLILEEMERKRKQKISNDILEDNSHEKIDELTMEVHQLEGTIEAKQEYINQLKSELKLMQKISSEIEGYPDISKTPPKKSTGVHLGDRKYLKSITIDGKRPCPVCDSWQSISHFSRHAKTHGYKSSMELLRAHEDECKAMYEKEKTPETLENKE